MKTGWPYRWSLNFASNIKQKQLTHIPGNPQKTYGFLIISGGVEVNNSLMFSYPISGQSSLSITPKNVGKPSVF